MDVLQESELKRWLAEDVAHIEAFNQLQRVWAEIGWSEPLNAAALERVDARSEISRPARHPLIRGMVASIGLIAACVSIVTMIGHHADRASMPIESPILESVFETDIGEVREIVLEDGTRVTLAGRSDIRVRFSANERRLRLTEGGGFFDVSKDPARPFVVETDQVEVRVTGTVFEVDLKPDHDKVSVVEGSVRVIHTSGGREAVLSGGEQALATRDGTLEVTPFDPLQTGAWRNRRLVFRNSRLQDLVSEVNRYFEGGVYLQSGELADLRVTASFGIEQVDTAMSGIALGLELETVRTETGAIILGQRRGAD